MKIYTTYFSNVSNLSDGIAPISIALKPPKDWCGLQYRALAPKEHFFYQWRESRDNDYYVEHFLSEVLAELDADTVVAELGKLAEGFEAVALVCYETPEEFCHRHLVAEFLRKNGFDAEEYHEDPSKATDVL